MSLFQKSVLEKKLQSLDKPSVEAAWERYAAHFLDFAKQENIRNSKEQQYQEGFLRELFVDVLGYVLNPSPGFNLTTELKNIGNAKKADGGIVQGDRVLAVIKLKGTAFDKTQTKRKKDGVFYTPRYITQYIVENTLGRLCNTSQINLFKTVKQLRYEY